MPASPAQRDFALEPADTERLANLAGPFDAHLRQIELRLGVEISNRGNVFRITGPEAEPVSQAEQLLRELYEEAEDETFDGHAINLRLNAVGSRVADRAVDGGFVPQDVAIRFDGEPPRVVAKLVGRFLVVNSNGESPRGQFASVTGTLFTTVEVKDE